MTDEKNEIFVKNINSTFFFNFFVGLIFGVVEIVLRKIHNSEISDFYGILSIPIAFLTLPLFIFGYLITWTALDEWLEKGDDGWIKNLLIFLISGFLSITVMTSSFMIFYSVAAIPELNK